MTAWTEALARRWRTRLGLALAFTTLLAIPATHVAAESLRDALALTYRYNPRLDAARAALRATDEEVARAHAGYRPTVTGSADAGATDTTVRLQSGARTGSGEFNPMGYAVTATQPVFRGFRTVNNVKVADATVAAGRENLRLVEQSVLLEAITAYMDTLRDSAIVKIRESNLDVLTRELSATRDRFRAGEVSRTDQAQAEARRAAARSALDLARANLKTSRGNYERSVGKPPSNLTEPRPARRSIPRALDEAIAIASREHPSVLAARFREQGARHTVDLIWGELLPTLTLEGSHARRFNPNTTTEQTDTTSVVARLAVPLYTNGDVEARVRASKHTHVSRIQEIEQNRGDIQAQVVQAWSQLDAAKAQLESDNAQVAALAIAVSGVREEEKVGQRTLLDVLNTEQEQLNAQVGLAATKRNIVVASYAVLAAVGRLNMTAIDGTDEVYDPAIHAAEVRRKWWGVAITHADGRRELHDFWHTLGRNFHDAIEARRH